jgi:hypothetical protein
LFNNGNPQSCQTCFNNRNKNCEEAIDEQTSAKHYKTSEDQETDEHDMTEPEQVTNKVARKFSVGLRLWFVQEANEVSPISAIEPAMTLFNCSQSREHGTVHSINSSVTNC